MVDSAINIFSKANCLVRQMIEKRGILYVSFDDNKICCFDSNGYCFKQYQIPTNSRILELIIDTLFVVCEKDVLSFNIESGQNRIFQGHTSWISRISVSAPVLYTASNDSSIRAWDIESGSCLSIYIGHTDGVTSLCIYGNLLFTGSADKTIKSWECVNTFTNGHKQEVSLCSCIHTFDLHTKLVFGVMVLEDVLYSASWDGTLRSWNLRTGKPISCYNIGHAISEYRVDLKAVFDGNVFIISMIDFSIHLFNLKSGSFRTKFVGHSSEITGLRIKYGSLYTCSVDKTIRKWSMKDGSCELILTNPQRYAITSISVTNRLCCGDKNGNVYFWEIASLASGKEKKRKEKLQLAEEIARLQELGIEQHFSPKRFSMSSSPVNSQYLSEREKRRLLKDILGQDTKKEKRHPYMVGDISRVSAELELTKCNFNSFLIRNSSVQGCLALSKFNLSPKKFTHILIDSSNGYRLRDSVDSSVYSSLQQLIDQSPELKGFKPVYGSTIYVSFESAEHIPSN